MKLQPWLEIDVISSDFDRSNLVKTSSTGRHILTINCSQPWSHPPISPLFPTPFTMKENPWSFGKLRPSLFYDSVIIKILPWFPSRRQCNQTIHSAVWNWFPPASSTRTHGCLLWFCLPNGENQNLTELSNRNWQDFEPSDFNLLVLRVLNLEY